jgi:HAE1 family hydrophobic/amphiphilic exporter-1
VGAESRRGLGLAVVGGLLVSQLLTLYITPVVYYYMDRIQTWAVKRFKKPQLSGVRADKEYMRE